MRSTSALYSCGTSEPEPELGEDSNDDFQNISNTSKGDFIQNTSCMPIFGWLESISFEAVSSSSSSVGELRDVLGSVLGPSDPEEVDSAATSGATQVVDTNSGEAFDAGACTLGQLSGYWLI